MNTKVLLACCGLAPFLAACDFNATDTFGKHGPAGFYVGALALSTPPVNTVLFGPCTEEFGMPDSRRANCNTYYWLHMAQSPWDERKAAYDAAAYQPGELQCSRTRGEIVDCMVITGPPHLPPRIAAPNNLGSE